MIASLEVGHGSIIEKEDAMQSHIELKCNEDGLRFLNFLACMLTASCGDTCRRSRCLLCMLS